MKKRGGFSQRSRYVVPFALTAELLGSPPFLSCERTRPLTVSWFVFSLPVQSLS